MIVGNDLMKMSCLQPVKEHLDLFGIRRKDNTYI